MVRHMYMKLNHMMYLECLVKLNTLKNFMKSIYIKNRIRDVNWINGRYILRMEGNIRGGLIFYNLSNCEAYINAYETKDNKH